VDGLAFVVIWTAGMALMMLPSAVPLLRLGYMTERSSLRAAALAAGYLATWATIAAAVAVLHVWIGMPLMDSHEQAVVVIALVVAAAYQAAPVQRRCLARCRGPLSQIFHGWREGIGGAFRMGIHNGVWCVGCCIGLVGALLVLGAMSVLWMALFFVAVTVEKTAPFGTSLSRALVPALAAGALMWAL
jgi:predicted metal-binding membrane protein